MRGDRVTTRLVRNACVEASYGRVTFVRTLAACYCCKRNCDSINVRTESLMRIQMQSNRKQSTVVSYVRAHIA